MASVTDIRNDLGVTRLRGSSMAKVTVLVVEGVLAPPHDLCEGLRSEPDITLVGETASRREALAVARQLQPDVIVLEAGAGWTLARQLHRQNRLWAVVILTAAACKAEARRTFRVGGAAYCRQDMAPHQLAQVLRQVMQGHYVLEDQVFDKEGLEARLVTRLAPRDGPDRPLSRRELDILRCLTQGQSNKEIALTLGISYQTVKNHMTSLLGKLRANDRTQLAVYALHHGLVHLGNI